MRNVESFAPRCGVPRSAEPWRAQLPIVAMLLLVSVAIGCQRDDTAQTATTPKRMASETDAAKQETNQPAVLTERQREVLKCLGRGRSNKEIARDLGLSLNTVKIHVAAVLRALGVDNRTQAAIQAQRLWPGADGEHRG